MRWFRGYEHLLLFEDPDLILSTHIVTHCGHQASIWHTDLMQAKYSSKYKKKCKEKCKIDYIQSKNYREVIKNFLFITECINISVVI